MMVHTHFGGKAAYRLSKSCLTFVFCGWNDAARTNVVLANKGLDLPAYYQ